MRQDFYHWLYEAIDPGQTVNLPNLGGSQTGSFHGGQSQHADQARQAILDKLKQIEKSKQAYKGGVEGEEEHIFGDDPVFHQGGPGGPASGPAAAPMRASDIVDFQRAMQALRQGQDVEPALLARIMQKKQ